MRFRRAAALMAAALLLTTPTFVAAADPSPAPSPAPPAAPVVTGLCATGDDYLWTISTDQTSLASYDVEYAPTGSDWLGPDVLALQDSGSYALVVAMSRDAGSGLSARWVAFPDQVGRSTTPNTTACATATVTVTITVQGGTVAPVGFGVTLAGVSYPTFATRTPTPFTSGDAKTVSPGNYIVDPHVATAPPGYFWRSTTCGSSSTTDPNHPRETFTLAPGASIACEIVFHYGPTLTDAIAPGKTTGSTGFGTSTLTVPKGTYVTYLVTTDPSLAGEPLEVWTKLGTGAWKRAATMTVADDGSVHYFAKVTASILFQGRWAGDATYVASVSHGRAATASTSNATVLTVSCDEFAAARDAATGVSAITRNVSVRVGGTVTVRLCENASTGFAWGAPTYDRKAVALTSHSTATPASPMAGAPGTEKWTFKVLKAATSKVSLAYGQPWTGGTKGAWTFMMTVHGTR